MTRREHSIDVGMRLLAGELETDREWNADLPRENHYFQDMWIRWASERELLPPIRVLALAILRDSEDEATVSAFLDEVMEGRKGQDEPVTEEWCRKHGWNPYGYSVGCGYDSPRKDRDYGVWFHPVSGSYGVDTFQGMHETDDSWVKIGDNPTIRQVIRLCRVLGIPWSASDPLGKLSKPREILNSYLFQNEESR